MELAKCREDGRACGREPLPNLERESSSCSARGMIAERRFWVFGVSILDSATQEVCMCTPRKGKGVVYKPYMHTHHKTNKMGLSPTSVPTILSCLLNMSQALCKVLGFQVYVYMKKGGTHCILRG